jgi:hypothetical protein
MEAEVRSFPVRVGGRMRRKHVRARLILVRMNYRGQQRVTRYAVVFRAGQREPTAGALVVETDRVRLEGRSAAGLVELSVPYAELTDVRIGRTPEERLNGRPALLLGREEAPPIQIEPFGTGLLLEIADLLATLANPDGDSSEQVAVIVPLKKGRLARAEELVAQGPPFDPAALGLKRHQVFLSARAATFVFAGPHVRATLERATTDPTLWRVGLAWRGCIAGRPRVSTAPKVHPEDGARLVYAWAADGQQAGAITPSRPHAAAQ